jgi:hypothetical protein
LCGLGHNLLLGEIDILEGVMEKVGKKLGVLAMGNFLQ